MTVTRRAGAGLLVVPNASPYEREKADTRLELCQRRAREAGATLAYVNMMGGQDELVFDGDSIIVDAEGLLLARGPQFEEALVVADLDLPAAGPGAPPADVAADAHDGTTMMIHRVTVPVDPALLTDSAPADSAGPGPGVAAAGSAGGGLRGAGDRGAGLRAQEPLPLGHPGPVRRDRLRADRHHRGRRDRPRSRARGAHAQRHSSGHSVADAEDLVKRQGLHPRTVAIQPMVDAFQADLQVGGLAAENLQARVRGVILMTLSNAEGHLVLTTGNKSEIATGYSTLYGDSAGGSRPSRTCRRRWSGILRGGATRRPPGAGRPRPSRRTRSSSRRAPSSPPGSSTPTRCPTTRCSTPCSRTTWWRTWVRPSSSPPGTTPPWWTG